MKIKITKDGPYIVSGNVPIKEEIISIGKDNEPEKYSPGRKFKQDKEYSLCRCGKSLSAPYCDGSHAKGFKGNETASKEDYIKQANVFKGPALDLTDYGILCASARFCHKDGGTWDNVEKSNDKKAKESAIKSACNCPSGRLVVWENGKAIEPKLNKEISVLQDPQAGVSGPLFIKGGIEIESADGKAYEKRNRVTLCRCGKSKNMPFCDSSHISEEFNDGNLKR